MSVQHHKCVPNQTVDAQSSRLFIGYREYVVQGWTEVWKLHLHAGVWGIHPLRG